MTQKFSSKELHFLKPESDEFPITPPETYFSDLISAGSSEVRAFKTRLEKAEIPGEAFLCAVIRISDPPPGGPEPERASDVFEDTFNAVLDHDRGIWESLGENAFALAFWDFKDEKKAEKLLKSLKEKIRKALNAEILMGMTAFPMDPFTRSQTFENALKAIDHAAFFGPDAFVRFDSVSLNISGDRLYQLGKIDFAIKEYLTGLELKPGDINLINSLGVCHAVNGDLDKAKEQFETAMKINPNEVMVVYNLGLVHQIDQNRDKAIIYLKKAHGINDRVLEVELILARLLKDSGQTEKALEYLENAEKIEPDAAGISRLRGEIFLDQAQPEKAAGEFNKAIKKNPLDAHSLSGYSRSLAMQGKNMNIALSFASNAVNMDPGNALFKRRLEEISNLIREADAKETTIKSA